MENNSLMYVFYHPEDVKRMHPGLGYVPPEFIRLHAVKVEMQGSNFPDRVQGVHPESYIKNFFIGNDPSKWASNVKDFNEVLYQNIYRDIDLKVYSKGTELKYDYIVNPGGDASHINLKYSGADKMYVKYGMLYMQLSVGTIVEGRPYAYQKINNEIVSVACDYVLHGNEIGFSVKKYDKNYPLVIDPTLVFSSYSGSTADNWGTTATYDNAGDLLTGGLVNGAGYPVTVGAYQSFFAGGGPGGNGFTCDIGFMKFNPTGTSLIYCTYVGGSDNEIAQSIFVDAADNMVVYGRTYSSNFPVTAGAYDVTYNGGGDIVIFKLNSSGTSLLASTYFGGSGPDGVNMTAAFTTMNSIKFNYGDDARGEIISDGSNNYFIAANTQSLNFPTTAGAYQTSFGGGTQDGCVFKFNTSLTSLLWSTYLGGNNNDACYGLKLDATGNIYVTGGTASSNFPTTAGVLHPAFQGGIADGFITHLAANGGSILQSTYIGTSNYDQTYFLEIDNDGDVYVTGQTMGNYPVSAGVYSNSGGKQFVHKMNPLLSSTFFSTVYGTNSVNPNISPSAFLVDTCENIYMSGWARCAALNNPNPNTVIGMPVTPNAFQSTTNGCDFYFIVLDHDAQTLLYATFFGGTSSNEHVDGGTSRFDKGGTIYQSVCAGCWGNSDFPTTPNAWSNTNNSSLCNNGVIKLHFDMMVSVSSFTATPLSGCAPFIGNFQNLSTGATGYVWDFGDGSPQDTSYQPTHVYQNPGVYTVMLIAVNNLTCNVSDTSYATVTVSPPPPINPAIQYTSSGGCDTLQVNFTAQYSAGHIFNWDFGDSGTASGINVTHTYTAPGTYTVTLIINDTICINADTTTIPITVNPAPPLNVAIQHTEVNICDTVDVTFQTNSNPSFVYNWDLGDGNFSSSNPVQHKYFVPGSYTVIVVVTDTICNSVGTDTTTIVVPPPGPISSSISYTPVQYCDSLVASLQAVANFGSVYSWNFGDGNLGSGSSVSHAYTVPGTYTVTLVVIDPVCLRYDTSYQDVMFYPIITSGIQSDTVISSCPPMTISLHGISNFAGSTFLWTVDNNFVSNNPSLTYTFNSGGTYTIMLIVSHALSCNLADTATFTITVLNEPTAAFIYENKPIYFADDGIHFYDQSIGASQWNWNFGDGTFSSSQHPVHGYEFSGVYQVCLTVSNSSDCPDIVCHEVPITETIYVPNVFTPNGDNKNEVFRIYYSGIFDMEVKIYNRWGELIHSWKGLDGYWDGTYKGTLVKEDVYIYYVVAKGYWEPEIVKVGRVTVVR